MIWGFVPFRISDEEKAESTPPPPFQIDNRQSEIDNLLRLATLAKEEIPVKLNLRRTVAVNARNTIQIQEAKASRI